jgi:lysozyme
MEKAVELLKKFEGLRLVAYQDSVGVWTIGYGTTIYPDGKKVIQGDICTPAQAELWLRRHIEKNIMPNLAGMESRLNDNRKAAIISFCYNLGCVAFTESTLKRKIMANPQDIAIRGEFLKWINAGGRPLKGLITRRKAEANCYFEA